MNIQAKSPETILQKRQGAEQREPRCIANNQANRSFEETIVDPGLLSFLIWAMGLLPHHR